MTALASVVGHGPGAAVEAIGCDPPPPDVEEVPDPLEKQVPIIEAVLQAFGIAVVGADHHEADDVIGTLATGAGMPVDVVTGYVRAAADGSAEIDEAALALVAERVPHARITVHRAIERISGDPTAALRLATEADGPVLAVLINEASHGLALHSWEQKAGGGGDPWSIGAARQAARARDGHWFVVDEGAGPVAGLLVVPPEVEPPGPDLPAVFRPLVELPVPVPSEEEPAEDVATEATAVAAGQIADAVEAALGRSDDLERALEGRIPLLNHLFPQFASRLIRNAATFGGNLSTGSPIGDSAPVFLALDARVVLSSTEGEREVPLSEPR